MKKHVPASKAEQPAKRRCHRCLGTGRAPCEVCGGAGQIAKSKDVYGNPKFDRCDGCFGLRTARCAICGGAGFA